MAETDARAVWSQAIEAVKNRTTKPALWRALEVSHGIVLDGDLFVVGFTPADYPQAGHLKSSEHRIVIERVLRELVGRPVSMKVIEGKTSCCRLSGAFYPRTYMLMSRRGRP